MHRLGIALGAGGARGWCHVGVLRELHRMGVEPDVVAGCSMGALVGAAWAGDKLDELETWGRALTQGKFLKYMDFSINRGGLVEGKAVMRVLQELGLPERIEDLPRPFLAVACDMATGREVWLREGNLAEAVRASVSIPGVFSPVKVRGRWLLDGGIINPVPTSATRALGATCTIAVNPDLPKDGVMWEPQTPTQGLWGRMSATLPGLPPPAPREPVPAYGEVVSVSIGIMMEFMRKAREAADPPDLTLSGDLLHISVLELYRAAEAIRLGTDMVENARDRISAMAGMSRPLLEDATTANPTPMAHLAAE
ncbi:patatin-like phospholipase family protein [Sagittula salina]|uniref:Patatin-like phospholipase family protein n=1 Tax=Sagittula salina TaxID=2820268 RepID=A0A940RZ88_9RHOB|nr:patatin-like phospholipase family protein [Sagittula salina]MBP0480876.1 patatin-like phospholipase family protein [Sagittula salina]